MPSEAITQLLASIMGNRLIIFCGAGLSMASSSAVPSAAQLSETCYKKYVGGTGEDLASALRNNLEGLTTFFHCRQQLNSIFVDTLVDWGPFNGNPNAGHKTIADFLACDALVAAVCTNIDFLIEIAAREIGDRTLGTALDGHEMNILGTKVLKIHGCYCRERHKLLWCHDQLNGPQPDETIRARVQASTDWLTAHLPNRDLVFVGFWSDWGYLNDVLQGQLPPATQRLVVIVDPASPADLANKAPGLWAWVNRPEHHLIHERKSGADFLEELRLHFGDRFLAVLLNASKPEYASRFGHEYTADIDSANAAATADEFYELRRDVTGTAPTDAVRAKTPDSATQSVGATYLRLRDLGGTLAGSRYRMTDGKMVRAVNGLGQSFSRVRARYEIQPDTLSDVVICCSTLEDGNVPANLLREGQASSVVRPATQAKLVTSVDEALT